MTMNEDTTSQTITPVQIIRGYKSFSILELMLHAQDRAMAFTSLLFILTSMNLFFFLAPLLHVSPTSAVFCHDYESSALLQFKESFTVDPTASIGVSAYPKVESWNQGKGDCCSWDGVECDRVTGYVTGLDLTGSCLSGSISSNSTIFQLVHLRNLSLADNYFQNSPIPSGVGHLSNLTYLNLSYSSFSGQIPSSISGLFRLSSLDLSWNNMLVFKNQHLNALVKNSASLEVLNLDFVDISPQVPDILANSSHLVSLSLRQCGLVGEFPAGILRLPKLEVLRLDYNNLRGHLPEFPSSSPLREFSVNDCNFSGPIPSSLGNLTQLVFLDLSVNPFSAQDISQLSWISNLAKLTYLGLQLTNLTGEIPPSFGNLTKLSYFDIGYNQLRGPLPLWLANLTQLTSVSAQYNELQGTIPRTLSQLEHLEALDLSNNNFTGPVELDTFVNHNKLLQLMISGNSLSLQINASSNFTQKLENLGLGSCNLTEFPGFLRHQDALGYLDLGHNSIHGKIPRWFLNTSTETIDTLILAGNFLTGFEVDPVVLPWTTAFQIDLSDNMLQAPLPLPPQHIIYYDVSSNKLTGELTPEICNATRLYVLALQDNRLSGSIPSCLGDITTRLEVLDLGRNGFSGTIPQSFSTPCSLKMIALDENQLEGKLPTSLVNCSALEFLDFGNNKISDAFPSWLGMLPELKVLLLRSNQFHGAIKAEKTQLEFPNLHIVDLSHNNFTGELPTQYFLKWSAMKEVETDESTYMQTYKTIETPFEQFPFMYSMSITNKRSMLRYGSILDYFVTMDLSSNSFTGFIPEAIGNLKGLRLLNISNNDLTGHIPSSLANLTLLESLDLSANRLSGGIPQQLSQLNFLAVFNVSYNHLSGSIPRGQQFDTFPNDSYVGNSGFCGGTLTRKCENPDENLSPPQQNTEDDEEDSLEFGWKQVLIGYGSGLVIGLVTGNIVVTRNFEWFAKTFRVRVRRRRRRVSIQN